MLAEGEPVEEAVVEDYRREHRSERRHDWEFGEGVGEVPVRRGGGEFREAH